MHSQRERKIDKIIGHMMNLNHKFIQSPRILKLMNDQWLTPSLLTRQLITARSSLALPSDKMVGRPGYPDWSCQILVL